MKAQELIDNCEEPFDMVKFTKELREAEFLADNVNKQEVNQNDI